MTGPPAIARVVLDVPLPGPFDYRLADAWAAEVGDWVVVPWGTARRVGLVVALARASDVPDERLKALDAPLPGMPRMPAHWLDFIAFGARYYHAGVGELALPSVPKLLRTVPGSRSRGPAAMRAHGRFASSAPVPGATVGASETATATASASASASAMAPIALAPEQLAALADIEAIEGHAVMLLHGITGSGKTEVYFRWLETRLAARPDAQALLLVPEIALTPRLAARIVERFPSLPLAVLHSDMPDAERAAHWLAAADGRARIVLGTRLAVLAPLPGLAAIVVDEEHDASFKQQEGARYSARDLAIALAARRGVPIVLGSATPSLETWHAVRRGRYRTTALRQRATGAAMPTVQRVSLRGATLTHGLTPPAIAAIEATVARGEQALVFLNRRGYAPVITCGACGWLSRCDQCDAYRVLHRIGRPASASASSSSSSSSSEAARSRYRLVCHHCGAEQRVPRACPDCGNVDLAALGRGTQRLEEGLQSLFPTARIDRLDRDVARRRGAAERMLDAVHAGDVDLLVGTQMLAKGHDFRRLTLVVVVDADAGLFAADFRAPERLFATLMQVAGRAGRHHASSRVLIQTRFPEHPVYEALAAHDYDRFAGQQLEEREHARLPPFVHQALLTAHAKTHEAAVGFLEQARDVLRAGGAAPDTTSRSTVGPTVAPDVLAALDVCDPVPMPLAQLRGEARAQMLVESASRSALHAALGPWLAALRETRTPVRWQIVVDPHEI